VFYAGHAGRLSPGFAIPTPGINLTIVQKAFESACGGLLGFLIYHGGNLRTANDLFSGSNARHYGIDYFCSCSRGVGPLARLQRRRTGTAQITQWPRSLTLFVLLFSEAMGSRLRSSGQSQKFVVSPRPIVHPDDD